MIGLLRRSERALLASIRVEDEPVSTNALEQAQAPSVVRLAHYRLRNMRATIKLLKAELIAARAAEKIDETSKEGAPYKAFATFAGSER